MTTPAVVLLQSTFVRLACEQRTDEDLRALRESVDRASGMNGTWPDRAGAHAEFHCLLGDATRAAPYSLLAYYIRDSMRDIITAAGESGGGRIVVAHRRLISYLEARDADSAIWEMRRYLAQLTVDGNRQVAVYR